MDANQRSPPSDNVDTKAAFRRPLSDAANRKYRRRSPVAGQSSTDGSPKHGDMHNSREDHEEVSELRQKKTVDEKELDRDSGRHYGRTDDPYRHSDRHSRNSHSHLKRDEYSRHERDVNDDEKNYRRSSSHAVRGSRSDHHSSYTRQESERTRSRDYSERYSNDKYDNAEYRAKDKLKETSSLDSQKYKDKNRSSDRSDRVHSRDESRGHRYDSSSKRDDSRQQFKEAYKGELKESYRPKHAESEKRKYDELETKRGKDQYNKVLGEHYEHKTSFINESQSILAKKPKSSNSYKVTIDAQEPGEIIEAGKSNSNDLVAANNLDAAKVAAMKAAELVNKNLVGTGYMTADQKKKLLWGSKKTTASEESGRRWDNTLLGDRERQEKFNKLMSLRLPWYLWPIVGCKVRREGRGSESKWQHRCREAEGTAGGLREAIYCWTASKRRAHCWIRALIIDLQSPGYCSRRIFCTVLLYSRVTFRILMICNLMLYVWILGFEDLKGISMLNFPKLLLAIAYKVL